MYHGSTVNTPLSKIALSSDIMRGLAYTFKNINSGGEEEDFSSSSKACHEKLDKI